MTPTFSIAAAQIASARGDVAANVASHVRAVAAAAAAGVAALVFPELSLTGYEPSLAQQLATTPDDARLTSLRAAARASGMTIVAGAPVANGDLPAIGAFVFTPGGTAKTYLKMHLGSSEGAFFSSGSAPLLHEAGGQWMGVAVCADSTRPTHPQTYRELGASIYAAGVFFTEEWYLEDAPRFAAYAAEFTMLTVMANHGASTGTWQSAGRSAVWAPGGRLLARADGTEDALVIARLSAGVWTGALVRF
jgi:predicted amidohydrolase